MKTQFTCTFALLALLAVGASPSSGKSDKPVPPKTAVAVPAVADVQASAPGGVDEIDLEDVDDSAVAAKRQPKVTCVKPEQKKAARPAVESPAAAPALNASLLPPDFASDEMALVDITCEDATLADILRQFRKTTGANIISTDSSNLNQRVSVTLNHVPWLQALQSILNARKFRLEPRSGIYFVSEDKQLVPRFTRTFPLNHASAKELAELFNSSLSNAPRDPRTGKPVASASIATAFEGANVVVVTADEKTLADCETIIKSVDKAVPQIYIEARFIEVSNEALHKLGMQWNQLESWGVNVKDVSGGLSFGNDRVKSATISSALDKVLSSESSQGSSSSSNTGLDASAGSSSSSLTSSGGSTSSSSTSGTRTRTSSRGIDGSDDSSYSRVFSGQLSADDFRLALSAFESMSDVKIFSNPKIIVSNGKEAKVDMTTKFPHIKVTSQRNNTGNESYIDMATEMQAIPGEDKMMFAKEAFFSWGITLDVKPRISPDGLISVEIVPTISQLDTDVSQSGFYEVKSDSGTGLYPIIQVKRLTTDFTMKDGATAVIGGLSKTTEEDIDSGIPYLRKIPWIGPKLFGWKSRGKVQKEIVVFVTLGIADPADLPADVGLPKNAVTGREFVEGRKLEPGERAGGIAALMDFDTRPIEQQRRDDHHAPGSVTITPVRKVMPLPVEPAKEPEFAKEVGPAKEAATEQATAPKATLDDLVKQEPSPKADKKEEPK